MYSQWDDIRIFLTVMREASMTQAAERLMMHQSTVSRRLKALEEGLGCSLVRRGSQGVSPTSSGKRLLELGIEMEKQARVIGDHFRKLRDAPKGLVRVTTVEEIAVQFIIPGLSGFRKRWPEVEIDLLTNFRILDLGRGEADVSVRLVRPEKGDLKAFKLGEFGYGIYASSGYIKQLPQGWSTPLEDLDWIFMEKGTMQMPEWAYIQEQIPNIRPILRSNSFKTVVATVQAGLGVALMPRGSSYFYPDLERFSNPLDIPKRELWLCVAADRYASAAVQAVCEFLQEVMVHPLQKVRAQARKEGRE